MEKIIWDRTIDSTEHPIVLYNPSLLVYVYSIMIFRRKNPAKSRDRPLSWTDSTGTMYHYYDNPLGRVCIFILVAECAERLAYYGIMPNLQQYLVDTLGITSNDANTLIEIFNGLIYVTPLVSAAIADTWLGTFSTILVFSCFYIAGLALLALSSLESISQTWMVYVSLFGLLTIGAGGIKSCVNILGGSQYHPEEHVEEITRFFTFFYSAINVGAIVGGIVVPIVQQATGSYFIGYLIPLCSFALAIGVFIIGSPRYIKMEPQGSQVVQVMRVIGSCIKECSPIGRMKESNGGRYSDKFVGETQSLLNLVPLFALTVPFNICYNQMTTVFYTQGTKLSSYFFGVPMTPSLMQNVDPISVIVFSLIVEYFLYNKLRERDMMPSVLVRFFVGCCMGTISVLCAMGLERAIMNSPDPENTISIWWQVPQFCFIAIGEIFLISTSYEVAFTYSPESMKAVGSALNLLFIGAAAFAAGGINAACASWMPSYDPTNPASWQDSHYDYFFILLGGISFVSGIASLLMRPYFDKYVKKPIERNPRSGDEETGTAVPNSMVESPSSIHPPVLTVVRSIARTD
jgi:solute carrier family 15 (peptide/histidine transporter), member 3/4